MFDVVIAYIVILLVLSTITTALLQLVQRVLPLRWWWLRSQLAHLYAQVTGRSDRAETLERAAALLQSAEVNPLQHRHPDFVEGAAVRRWLCSNVPGGEAHDADANADAEPGIDGEEAATQAQPEPETTRPLPTFLDDDMEFERWWKTIEDQMSAAFRLRVVFWLSVIVGLGLSWVTGLEAMSVAQHLSESPAEVEALLDDADRQGGGSRRDTDDRMLVRLVQRQLQRSVDDDTERARMLVCFDDLLANESTRSELIRPAAIELRLAEYELPDPPDDDDPCAKVATRMPETLLPAVRSARHVLERGLLGFGGYPLTDAPSTRVLGHIIMALLIALGAPLWFELLSLLRLPLSSRPRDPTDRT